MPLSYRKTTWRNDPEDLDLKLFRVMSARVYVHNFKFHVTDGIKSTQ